MFLLSKEVNVFFFPFPILQPGSGGSISSLLVSSKSPWAQPDPAGADQFLPGALAQGQL